MLLDYPLSKNGKTFNLDLKKGEYSFVEVDKKAITRGTAIEIYLKKEKKCIAALYTYDNSLFFRVGKKEFNLNDFELTAKLRISSFSNEFILLKDGVEILKFKYKYKYRDEDIIEDVYDILNSSFKKYKIKHLIKFYSANSNDERISIDEQNTDEINKLKKANANRNSLIDKLKTLMS